MSSSGLTLVRARVGHRNRWWYVVTGFVTLLFGTSTVNVLVNVLATPMTEEFGWDRSVMTNGLSLQTVMVGISIVALGFLIDRYGPRIPSVPMSLGFGGGIMLMAALPNSEFLYYLLCFFVGASAGAVNPVAHSAVVSAWFKNGRGLAIGILMTGLGACGVMMPYLASWVLAWGGWRMTFLVIGALCMIIPASVYAFVTKMPAEHDAERRAARKKGTTAGESLLTIARKYRQFWLLSIAIFLVSSATFGLMGQTVPLTTDKGVDAVTAVTVLSVLSLSSIAARFIVGFLLDLFYAPMVSAVIFSLCGVGVFLLITSPDIGLIFLGAALVGLGLGAEGDVAAYMCSRYFPQHSYGRVLGFVYFLYAQGSAFGIFLLGQIHSATGSYQAGALPIILMVAVAIICLLFMGPYRFTLDHHEAVTEAQPAPVGADPAQPAGGTAGGSDERPV
ncbi:MFS transporter [Nocardiopsis oceani]